MIPYFIKIKHQGIPLQNKLFSLFIIFILLIMVGLFFVLILSGVFRFGLMEQSTLLESQLTYTSNNVYNTYREISVESVNLSQSLSALAENYLAKHNLNPDDLSNHPDVINSLLSELFYTMHFSLQKVRSSGIFLILDSLAPSDIGNSSQYYAGLFIKNMDPSFAFSQTSFSLLKGPAFIAQNNNFNLHSQWSPAYDLRNASYFYKPLSAAKSTMLPLSRLYYWSESVCSPQGSEKGMYCSVPIILSDRTVIGVCGFEISNMLFKVSYEPVAKTYSRLFCMLSPIHNGKIDLASSLYTENFTNDTMISMDSFTPNQDIQHTFYTYKPSNGIDYAGLHSAITLYPTNSYFQDEKWVVTVLMPKEDLTSKISGVNKRLLLFLSILMTLSIGIAIYISRRYIAPIIEAINLMKTQEYDSLPKTRIPEIDDLIEFLSKQDKLENKNDCKVEKATLQSFTKFNTFVQNIDTLTKSERAVFNLYIKGYTANEIAEALYVSINTVKTHNKHIYSKLNVSGRKELLIYVQMMEETLP